MGGQNIRSVVCRRGLLRWVRVEMLSRRRLVERSSLVVTPVVQRRRRSLRPRSSLCSPLSVTALIRCRSGCGSLVASSVNLIVVSFEVFCALVGCVTSSRVMRRSVC